MGAALHQPALAQTGHVGGDGGLGQAQFGGQIPDADLAVGHPLHDGQPLGVTQGVEQGRGRVQAGTRTVRHDRHTPIIATGFPSCRSGIGAGVSAIRTASTG